MQDSEEHTYKYINQNTALVVFVQQSENCQLVIGKVKVQVKKQMNPLSIIVQIKGMYRIWDSPKEIINESTQTHWDIHNISHTLTQFDQFESKRYDKQKINNLPKQKLEREEFFLEGKQKIVQIDQNMQFKPDKQFIYPFLFNVPNKLPPSLESVWFAGKRIEIKYFLQIKGIQKQEKQPLVNTQFQISIRQSSNQKQSSVKFCRILQYSCFTRFFCRCLGSYHIELNSTVLRPGQIQVEGRVFCEGKSTSQIINSIQILLMGQLKNVQKMVITQKKMILHQNQYEMLEGQVLLNYDTDLRTFESELINIYFWIDCKVQFKSNIWKLKRKDVIANITI